jgi:hypothetical protein
MENMHTFKRKALFTAMVAGLGAAGSAEAVYMSPNHTGQVLLYPYYTVQAVGGNSYNTYLSVVNTTTTAKAVKVRILEGKTSAEVLDFNLFLSPNDVWTAAIIPSDATDASPGRIVTSDRSCTRPAIPAAGEPFRNYLYANANLADSLPGSELARTREGYVEMLEMGTLTGATATAITHNSAGVPANCTVVQQASFTSVPAGQLLAPTGGLMGTGTLINVNSGLDSGYKADALDAWSTIANYSDAGFLTPNLASAQPAQSLVISSGEITPFGATGITAYRSDFVGSSGATAGAKAVASVFMHASVMNEYVLDTNTASNTDWVITQPLKNLFVTDAVAAQPYNELLTTDGACERVSFTFFDREEQGATAGGVDFSPLPEGAAPDSLCWESNVLSIRNPGASHTTSPTDRSLVLGSRNMTNVNVRSGFQNGWARLTFLGPTGGPTPQMGSAATTITNLGTNVVAPSTVGPGLVTFHGLPVTGFMVRTFINGGVVCASGTCQGNYGSLFSHSYTTTITP